MQARNTLSKPQFITLESLYLFLRTLEISLASIGNNLPSDSPVRQTADGQRALAEINQRRMLRYFPELAESARKFDALRGEL